MKEICIIGGGISGIMSAIKLSKTKNNHVVVDVYEMRNKILDSLPYCHLHAGGLLYPMISLLDCKELLLDSLLFAEYFNKCLYKRPTIIAYTTNSTYCSKKLLYKCKVLKYEYINWCNNKKKQNNHILGNPYNYYCEYTKEDVVNYKKGERLNKSKYHDKYVEEFCKLLKNIDDIKYPFISVCEYGINQKMVEDQLINEINEINKLQKSPCINLYKNTCANVVKNENCWIVNNKKYDILVNASGYKSKDVLQDNKPEFIELKSSWIIKSNILNDNILPEIAIIGARNTKDGMLQITPLLNNIFQIHYMSSDSSIVNCINQDVYIKDKILPSYIDIQTRVTNSIIKINQLFTGFEDSIYQDYKMGFQRIVDSNKNKRISELIQNNNYLEFRVLKAISIVKLINQIEF